MPLFARHTVAGLAAILGLLAVSSASAEPRHGIAMLGEPRYQAGFVHFDYTDPAAAKGGTLRQAIKGTFDSLNPYIIKGSFPLSLGTNVFEPLMARAYDEPFSLYGLIAETIETPADRSFVEFTLRNEAHFSDGKPITQDDVLFSWETLRDHGRPNHRGYYAKVAKAEKVGTRGVRFTFKPGTDREMALIMGLMPVLPKHVYSVGNFEDPVMKAVGSGPYVVGDTVAGRTLRLKRDPGYWAKDLNFAKGRFNFDELTWEYYQDQTAMFEGFKAGAHDFMEETDAAKWLDGFDFPAAKSGDVKKEELGFALPAPTAALVFNLRRPLWADQRVRKAFNLLFDFEWIGHNLYRDSYTRLQSFFDRSALKSYGTPANEAELALLKPFPNAASPEALAGTLAMPKSDGQGWNRANAKAALDLLKQAGWELKGGVMTNITTGTPLTFEVPAQSRTQERLLLEYAAQLKRVGIAANIRLVDDSQFQQRLTKFDYDMIYYTWYTSLSPGNEQSVRWSSAAAAQDGSFNFAGIKNPAADAMIDALIHAKDQAELTAAVRALDRVLLSGDYVIPLYYPAKQWLAYKKDLRRPATTSLYGYLLDTWWMDAKTP
jgi:peptide/nickel transport system substrate-binding protein